MRDTTKSSKYELPAFLVFGRVCSAGKDACCFNSGVFSFPAMPHVSVTEGGGATSAKDVRGTNSVAGAFFAWQFCGHEQVYPLLPLFFRRAERHVRRSGGRC